MRFSTLATTAFTLIGCLTGTTFGQVAVQSGLTADSFCDQGACLTGLYSPDSKMINYTLVIQKGKQPVGWYGIGQGTQMVGANMAVNWINGDNTLTTSHRSTTAQVQPLVSEVTVQAFSVNNDVSKTTTDQTVWSWNMPLPTAYPMNAVQHVMAIASVTPTSSATDATIVKHYYTNTGITLDFTKAYNGSSPAGFVGSTQSVSNSSNQTGTTRNLDKNYVRIYLVHMIFMVLGWQLCFPIGILLARYGRTMFTWFPYHRAVQSFGFLLVFIAFFLAIAAVSIQGIPHFGTTHQKLGLALFILLVVQVVLGATSHSLKKRKGLRHVGYVHIPFGLIIYALSVWNIHEGFSVWDWNPPAYASYIIYAWAGFMTLLYLIGFAFLPKELKQRNNEAEKPLNHHTNLDSPSERASN